MLLRLIIAGILCYLHTTANAALPTPPSQPPSVDECIQKMSPLQALQIIEGVKTRAFSKDLLIYSGLDEADLKPWHMTLQKTRESALHDDPTNKQAEAHFTKVQELSQQTIATIQQWHPRLNPLYREKNAEELAANTNTNKIFDPTKIKKEDVSTLTNDLKLASLHTQIAIHTLRMIAQYALHIIIDPLPEPETWKNRLYKDKKIKNAKSIIPHYKKVLKDFQQARDGKKLARFIEENHLDQEKIAIPFISNLEKIIFIMNEKKLNEQQSKTYKFKQWVGLDPAGTRAALIETASELLQLLRQRHPDVLSDLTIAKIYVTTNKPALILFAQAFNLLCVTQALLKNIETIRQAINKTYTIFDAAPQIKHAHPEQTTQS